MDSRLHHGTAIASADDFEVIACEPCGFSHITPLPSEEELTRLYESELYETERPNYFKDMEEDESWWMDTYRNHYALMAAQTSGRRLLEVGSGPGHFLKCGQELGWDVVGVEPSDAAHQYSTEVLKVPTIKGFFTAELLKEYEPFDAVYLNLVLEHIPNPQELLQEVRSVLKDDGIVFILVPNDFNALQRSARLVLNLSEWWIVPMHLNYFSFASLSGLLTSAQFTVTDTLATFPMEFFLLSGENYVGNSVLGRACHTRRKNFEQNLYKHDPETLNGWYRSLACEGLGRECVVIAKKSESK
jgi:SAM-dependent methyltransferase